MNGDEKKRADNITFKLFSVNKSNISMKSQIYLNKDMASSNQMPFFLLLKAQFNLIILHWMIYFLTKLQTFLACGTD